MLSNSGTNEVNTTQTAESSAVVGLVASVDEDVPKSVTVCGIVTASKQDPYLGGIFPTRNFANDFYK